MTIGERIKRIRTSRGLSQKEVVLNAGIDKAQFSRIENGKTDTTINTVEKIAKALGISTAELFSSSDDIQDINSIDKSLLEKISLIDTLEVEEKKTIYLMIDTFIGKKKLKESLSNILTDI
jgi:transcriptional regulator with XRE-family HTH domain